LEIFVRSSCGDRGGAWYRHVGDDFQAWSAYALRSKQSPRAKIGKLKIPDLQLEEQQVMEVFDKAKAWIVRITELGLLLVALGIVLQMLFGNSVVFFGDIVGNVIKLVSALGSNGVVGLVAIAIILYLFNRK
jgi:hypothetical protein